MSPDNVTFFEGFSWAVPIEFATPLGACRFETGDILYAQREGYLPWSEALKHLAHSIQIKYPPKSTRVVVTDSVISDNWFSKVQFVLTDYRTRATKEIETTQGKLYWLLWKGNLCILDPEVPTPEVPKPLTVATKMIGCFAECIKTKMITGMEKPNVWIMPYDPTNTLACTKLEAVRRILNERFVGVVEKAFPIREIITTEVFFPTLHCVAFAIDLGGPEKMRDALKEVLYKPVKDKKSDRECFKLATHGHFIPCLRRDYGELVTISFDHGHFCRYRFHQKNIQHTPSELQAYLSDMMTECPNHYFQQPPFTSKLHLDLGIKTKRDRLHRITDLAGASLGEKRYKESHENLQMYFLAHDPGTMAVEIPVWASMEELGTCSKWVTPHGVLTGHIDLLRYEGGTIEVWDFKPGAFEEKYAAAQVFLYTVMLSIRTGLPLDRFSCGYFDASNAFLFDAAEAARQLGVAT